MLERFLVWMDMPTFLDVMLRFFAFGIVGVAALLALAAFVDRFLPIPRRAGRRGRPA